MLADQRRLVAPGQRIDDARLARPPRQQRPRQRVGLHVDHDDVLAVPDRRQAQLDAAGRIAGRLDHHVDLGVRDHGHRVVGDECLAASSARRPASWPRSAPAASRRPSAAPSPAPASGRRARRDACPASAAPATGTWCRTCRRRPGRCGSAARRPRARAAWMRGSSSSPRERLSGAEHQLCSTVIPALRVSRDIRRPQGFDASTAAIGLDPGERASR